VTASTLVGREKELAELHAALRDVSRGRGRVLFFSGGAGLGKSRLAAECIALATEQGALAVSGRCRETDGAPPYWPWTQVLRALRAKIGSALDGATFADAGLLTQALRVTPDAGAGIQVADAFLVYDAMARTLAQVAAERPLVIVLDDLHSADVGSLRMLRFVLGDVESSPIAFVGTYRDDEVAEGDLLTRILGEVATAGATRLLALEGLDASGVASVISSITGAPVEATTAEAVRARTDGNPFFVTEVARLGVDGAAPRSVREAVRARVRRLPEATRAVLATSSVLGRDFGGDLLEAVAGVRGVSLVAALQPDAQARLIASDAERQGRYRFVHALVQEVLYTDLSDEARRATHARTAEAVDALPPSERAARLDELAFHASAASHDAGSRERAATLCEAAARQAEATLALEDAARWYRRARELAPDRQPLELLFAEADALARTPDASSARSAYEEAFDRAARTGDGAAAARAALGVGSVVVSAGRIDQRLAQMLERAGRLVPPDDPASIELEARRAIEGYWQADLTSARSTAASALARARASKDSKALGAALHARQFVLRGPDDLAERVELGQRLLALAVESGDHALEISATTWLVPEHFAAGDMVAVGRAIAALDELERRVRRPLTRWHVLLFECMRAAFEGRYEGLLPTIDRTLALGRRIGSQPAELYAAAQRTVVLRDLGRAEESIRELRDLAAEYPILVTLRCSLGVLLGERGETAEAREILDLVARDDFALVPRDSLWRASVALAAQAAAVLGHARHARVAAGLLGPYVGLNVVQGVPVAWGATDHYVGVALAACGDLDAAAAHLEAAVRLHTAWGAAAFAVASRAELANVLVRRGRAEDRPRVGGLEAAVRAERERLGIVRPLLVREGRAPTPQGAARGALHGLTERETEILRLLATGRANKEIAVALRISVHTVERHLANVYAKIGARNRTDAVTSAAARGLLDGPAARRTVRPA
jgi:DNA-binding CsgD family transcriptional regulator